MANPQIHEPQLALLTRLKSFCRRLRDDTKYSDMTLRCKGSGKEFKVHKNIVCGQVKPIARALEGMWKESQSAVYEFLDEDEETVAKFVDFLYTQDFLGHTVNGVLVDGACLSITKVYIMADKYDVPALQELAVVKFEKALHKLEGERYEAWPDKSLGKAIRLMYEETVREDRALKSLAANFIAKTPTLLYHPAFESLLEETVAIGVDIAKAMAAAGTPQALLAQPERVTIVSKNMKCSKCRSNTFEILIDAATGNLKCVHCGLVDSLNFA